MSKITDLPNQVGSLIEEYLTENEASLSRPNSITYKMQNLQDPSFLSRHGISSKEAQAQLRALELASEVSHGASTIRQFNALQNRLLSTVNSKTRDEFIASHAAAPSTYAQASGLASTYGMAQLRAMRQTRMNSLETSREGLSEEFMSMQGISATSDLANPEYTNLRTSNYRQAIERVGEIESAIKMKERSRNYLQRDAMTVADRAGKSRTIQEIVGGALGGQGHEGINSVADLKTQLKSVNAARDEAAVSFNKLRSSGGSEESLDAAADAFERLRDKAKALGEAMDEVSKREKERSDKIDKISGGFHAAGQIAGAGTNLYRELAINQPAQILQNRMIAGNLMSQKYGDYEAAGNLDAAAIRRMSTGWDRAMRTGAEYGNAEQKAKYGDAISSGLGTIGSGMTAYTTGGIVGLGATVGGAANTIGTTVDISRHITSQSTALALTSQQLQTDNAVNAVRDRQNQKYIDYSIGNVDAATNAGQAGRNLYTGMQSARWRENFGNAGIGSSEANRLAMLGARGYGADIGNFGIENMTYAKQLYRQGSGSPEENLQRMMTMQTSGGGGLEQFKRIMTEAVSKGMDDAKSLGIMTDAITQMTRDSGGALLGGGSTLAERMMGGINYSDKDKTFQLNQNISAMQKVNEVTGSREMDLGRVTAIAQLKGSSLFNKTFSSPTDQINAQSRLSSLTQSQFEVMQNVMLSGSDSDRAKYFAGGNNAAAKMIYDKNSPEERRRLLETIGKAVGTKALIGMDAFMAPMIQGDINKALAGGPISSSAALALENSMRVGSEASINALGGRMGGDRRFGAAEYLPGTAASVARAKTEMGGVQAGAENLPQGFDAIARMVAENAGKSVTEDQAAKAGGELGGSLEGFGENITGFGTAVDSFKDAVASFRQAQGLKTAAESATEVEKQKKRAQDINENKRLLIPPIHNTP